MFIATVAGNMHPVSPAVSCCCFKPLGGLWMSPTHTGTRSKLQPDGWTFVNFILLCCCWSNDAGFLKQIPVQNFSSPSALFLLPLLATVFLIFPLEPCICSSKVVTEHVRMMAIKQRNYDLSGEKRSSCLRPPRDPRMTQSCICKLPSRPLFPFHIGHLLLRKHHSRLLLTHPFSTTMYGLETSMFFLGFGLEGWEH